MYEFNSYHEAANAIKTWLGPMRKVHSGNDFGNEFIDAADFMTRSFVRENVEKAIMSKEWNDCHKSIPTAKYGESDDVIALGENGIMYILYFDGGNWCYPTGECFDRCRITHWIPLPDRPPIEE